MHKKASKFLLIISLCLFVIAGCSSNMDRDKYEKNVSDEIKQIEMFNIASDVNIFNEVHYALNLELDKLAKEETDKEVIIKKSSLAQINYMNKIYELAVTRIQADIQGIYNDSEEYISYIALLQTYADAFSKDKESLLNELDVTNDNFQDYESTTTLSLLEGYYLNIMASIDK